MNAAQATIDLDDTEGLLAADRDGLLRAASMGGAQVRAVAAALDEGALDSVRGDDRPRTIIWVAGRGAAENAGTMLAATSGGSAAAPIVVAAEAPPWIGALDVLIVAGDDPGDPALVGAAASGVRRGARVVIAAPYEGPLRDATAGRVAVLEPRLSVAGEFGLVSIPGRWAGRSAKRRSPVEHRPGRAGRRTGRRSAAQQRQPRSLHQSGQGAGRADVAAARRAGRRQRRDPDAGPARLLCAAEGRAGGGRGRRAGRRPDGAAGRSRAGVHRPGGLPCSTTRRSTGRSPSGCGCWH